VGQLNATCATGLRPAAAAHNTASNGCAIAEKTTPQSNDSKNTMRHGSACQTNNCTQVTKAFCSAPKTQQLRIIRPTHRLPNAVQLLRLTRKHHKRYGIATIWHNHTLHTSCATPKHTCCKPLQEKARAPTNPNMLHMQKALWGISSTRQK
jgi:hypothetical protein